MNSRVRTIRTAFLLGLLALLTAWPGAAQAQQRPRDPAKYRAWLENQVRHELVTLPYYSLFDNLEYRVEGDKVTLLGQVVRPSTKSDAEARVKKIEGVTSVANQIEILPASPMDDHIRFREYRAIYSSGFLSHYALAPVPPVHIIVNEGHVTLEGVVATEAEKNAANIAANGVPGVFSVTNHLRVEKESPKKK